MATVIMPFTTFGIIRMASLYCPADFLLNVLCQTKGSVKVAFSFSYMAALSKVRCSLERSVDARCTSAICLGVATSARFLPVVS